MPGIEYKLVLYSYNMHNEDDFAKLTWRIQCANPIIPEDWKLHYEPFLHSDTAFNMSLTIEAEKVDLLQYLFIFENMLPFETFLFCLLFSNNLYNIIISTGSADKTHAENC